MEFEIAAGMTQASKYVDWLTPTPRKLRGKSATLAICNEHTTRKIAEKLLQSSNFVMLRGGFWQGRLCTKRQRLL
jgi:hypothetical protein